ncbi:Lanthionine synthetase C-like protein [Coccomyxa subellipsoidea C-169]|uniref:Lanthionine synthetase C-like protein n=1 Tax=Coccomyxa subellipsoidea (strain C-169) TaxID=574566 RepID=I0YPB4_COCSC|nr:Lanthionine synthetase C-like protein [Coccomyxa subellipsoidea C-169]EIE20233.1 Lanthionine synthetase C-like protein [Coccomyxa subellipsoidea C-169]|eukprot:XP_005644777.1 Lanthionine synthetase C-like protein [Coccomyxa subellipsoidea C-169]
MAHKHFANHLSDDALPDLKIAYSKLISALQDTLVVLEQGLQKGRGVSGSTVYVGLAGIALTYFRLYECCKRLKHADSPGHVKSSSLAGEDHAEVYLQRAAAVINAAGTSPSLQELGPAVLQMPPGECELLYGRSGYLYALLFTQKYLGSSAIRTDLVKAVVQQILDEGRRGARRVKNTPLMWAWHSKYYLGAAHGVSRILHTLLLACKMYDPAELYPGLDVPKLIEQSTVALAASLQGNNGNLPSTWGYEDDRLVQWCHGAPGFLPLVAKVYAQHPQELLATATQRAADVTWTRGLLVKGVGLCHGISGNAYSLLSAYRSAGDERYFNRAVQFGASMADHWRELLNVPERPLSLYEGLGGAICFWADVMVPARSTFPGYEL